MIRFRIQPHPIFHREGLNVMIDLPLTVSELALGCKKQIETIDSALGNGSSLCVDIDAGSDTKQVLLFSGMGISNPQMAYKQRGNLLVRLSLNLPKKLTDTQRRLFEELQKTFEEHDETATREGQLEGDDAVKGSGGQRPPS